MDVYIRWMIRADMRQVIGIEEACFEFPWSERQFETALRARNCVGFVAEHKEHVVGFMVYELHQKHLHLLSMAVAPFQGKGVGTALVGKLISKLEPHKRSHIVTEIRETNLDALNFFKGRGFRATELLRGFYDDSPEDAIRMEFWVDSVALDSVLFGDGKVVRVAE